MQRTFTSRRNRIRDRKDNTVGLLRLGQDLYSRTIP